MDTELIYELIGYAASLLVAISLMMSRIVKLRLVNTAGAVTFTIYGILISSMPVAFMNAFIVAVNIYHLVNIFRKKSEFDLIEVNSDNPVLNHFLEYHKEEILSQQPAYDFSKSYPFNLMIFNKMSPVGVLSGAQEEETLNVDLDFVIPSHRDFKAGEYVYKDRKDIFQHRGIRIINAKKGEHSHNRYLDRMGFTGKGKSDTAELILASDS
jgi:hypothetical protein